MTIEGLIGQLDGMPRKERVLALPAARFVAEPGGWDAVRGLAVRAYEDWGLTTHFKAR
jgi:hypothetical protein